MTLTTSESEDRVIDLAAKKTEDGWSYAIQGFFERFTPLWFQWVGWVIALGGVSYLADISGSLILKLIEFISYWLLSFYYAYYLGSLRIEPFHSWAISRSSKFKRSMALLPFFILGMLLWLGTKGIIDHVVFNVKALH